MLRLPPRRPRRLPGQRHNDGCPVAGRIEHRGGHVDPAVLIKAAAQAVPASFHVHYYVDTDASALKPGEVIPSGNPAIIHSGDTNLNLNLTHGAHRVTVVLVQLSHAACGDATGKVVTATAAMIVAAAAPAQAATPAASKTGNAGLASGTSSLAVLGLLLAAPRTACEGGGASLPLRDCVP